MSSFNNDSNSNEHLRSIYDKTDIIRKPITGIVSGYHQLSYILVSPDEQDTSKCFELQGKINVSPKFIISPSSMGETFGDVFDPETFDSELQGRLFSFAYSKKRNLKVENDYLTINHMDKDAEQHLNTVADRLSMQENITTALIFCPEYNYYPVSLDRFISEILDREFKV
ncbi:MAG: hypothetical protein ACOC4C_00105 [Fibrobacterota bacterium]